MVPQREEPGDAGGVDGGGGVGGEALEMIPMSMGEEVVPLPAGIRRPRVHREGEPPRHLYRHPPPPQPLNFSPLRLSPSPLPQLRRTAGGESPFPINTLRNPPQRRADPTFPNRT